MGLTLLLVIAASAVHRYPFSERLALFCAPLIVLPFAFAVGIDWWRRSMLSCAACFFVFAILLIYPVYLQAKYLIHPEVLYDAKPAISYVKANWHDGDSLYLHWGSDVLGNYYLKDAPVLGIPGGKLIEGVYEPDLKSQLRRYADDLLQVQGRDRVWVVFSMGAAQDQAMFEQILSHRGKRLDHRQFNGGAADLYDLR
jgi:hypothetical protein